MCTPKPINTEGIQIPSDLMSLTEEIAANVHDVWVAGRISEGWTYGEVKAAEFDNIQLLRL